MFRKVLFFRQAVAILVVVAALGMVVSAADVRIARDVRGHRVMDAAERTSNELLRSIGEDEELDVAGLLAKAQAAKAAAAVRFAEAPEVARTQRTHVVVSKVPHAVKLAKPAVVAPTLSSGGKGLFSWASTFVEPAKVAAVEPRHQADAPKMRFMRVQKAKIVTKDDMAPSPNETEPTASANASSAIIDSIVETVAGSFVLDGVVSKQGEEHLDHSIRKVLEKVVGKGKGRGTLLVESSRMSKTKVVAEKPPGSVNKTVNTTAPELLAEQALKEPVADEPAIDGDATALLLEVKSANASNATAPRPSSEPRYSVRVNFALRSIRAGSDAVSDIVAALENLKNDSSTVRADITTAAGASNMRQIQVAKFQGEAFDVCENLCSRQGTCQEDGACKCNEGFGTSDCSEEFCAGGCVHGHCNETAKACVCDTGYAGVSCERQSCPNDCSQHGECDLKSGYCKCLVDWEGDDCSLPKCAKNCSYHGECTATPGGSVCTCESEWTGDYCDIPACPTSDATPEKVCSGKGKCSSGKCVCRAGYQGEDCSEETCPNNCFGNGECKNWACECFAGWEGVACNIATCAPGCEKHGNCQNGTCKCRAGFTGPACLKLDCPEDCNGRGLCTNANKACIEHSDNCTLPVKHVCKCEKGFSGETCEKEECPDGCTSAKHGTCNFKTGKCTCTEKYFGANCAQLRCPGRTGPRDGCSGHGFCNGTNGVCSCHAGWIHGLRKDCNWRACPGGCSGHGACLNGTCMCNEGFEGDNCKIALCPGTPVCGGRGACNNTDGTCSCRQGFTGKACELEACPKNCNGKGSCGTDGKCACFAGFTGDDCGTRFVVHGEVLDGDKVRCYHGYGGPDCNVRECRNNCSSRGICVEGTCYCKPSWTGDHCQHAACPNECYYHGKCERGVCKCEDGFRGIDCSRRHVENGKCHVATGECECDAVKKPAFPGQMWTGASCEAKTCSKNCTGRGVCDKNGECLCNPDWMGISCEKPACPYACHGNGKCVEGTCKCDDMWSGEACEQRQYWCPKDCSGRGTCVKSTNGTHSCKCNKLPVKAAVRSSLKAMFEGQQWAGSACDTLSCPANDNGEECSLHGSCKNGKCQCDELYSGHMCQISSCKDGCNFHGTCKKGPNGVAFCKCEDGFAGSDCAKKICPGNGECSKHGDCNEKRATCKCHAGWEGPGCAKPICPDNCNNHGECRDSGCKCNLGWSGKACSLRTCPSNCHGVGKCIDGKCRCDDYHTGADCSMRRCPADCNKRGVCNKKSFSCLCAPGFKGEKCERTTCGHSCGKHGRCSLDESGLSAHCECAPGHAGGVCEHTCEAKCHGHGKCGLDENGQPKCVKCDEGYGGAACEHRCPNGCSGKGECMITGKCACAPGYTGASCNMRACPEQCSGNGLCDTKTGLCHCNPGFAGDSCDVHFWRCPKNCANHGACLKQSNGSYACHCDPNWQGAACDVEQCDPICKNGGVCKDKTCMCAKGWTGLSCSLRVCPRNCMAHGRCTPSGKCACDPGFKGPACSIRFVVHGACNIATKKCKCHNVEVNASFPGQRWTGPTCMKKTCPANCSSHGTCGADGTCACKGLWMGSDCSVPVCKNLCTGHGKCVEGKCACSDGYSGEDCSVFDAQHKCPKACSNRGECMENRKCKCEVGWEGEACDLKMCAKGCNVHGECVRTPAGKPVCQCQDGYTGNACEKTCAGGPTCSGNGKCAVEQGFAACVCRSGFAGAGCEKACPEQCNGQGACYLNPVGNPECACRNGYTGWACEKSPCPRGCSEKGKCVNGKCECDAEWSGPDCSARRCPRACSGKGACSGAPAYKCTCQAGFTGDDCSVKLSCINDCSGNGECKLVQMERSVMPKCDCNYGFGGADCSEKKCGRDVTGRECSGHGQCQHGVCVCFPTFEGALCDLKNCRSATGESCSGHGFCSDEGKCDCEAGFTDSMCSTRVCPIGLDKKMCSGRGVCTESVCGCDDGFFGDACELGGETAVDNTNVSTPVAPKPSSAQNEIDELKKMAAAASNDPMQQASIEKVIKSKEEEFATGATGTEDAPEEKAITEAAEKERKEEVVVKKLQRELRQDQLNPTEKAIVEQRLEREKRGLAAAKVDEEVAIEDKATKDAEKEAVSLAGTGATGATGATSAPTFSTTSKKVNRTESGCGACFNGECLDGMCVCKEGWRGMDCSKQTCSAGCKHGQCVEGTCQCDVDAETGVPAFFGKACDLRQCAGSMTGEGEFKPCSGHGQCMSVGDKLAQAVCDCQDGWGREDCSLNTDKNSASILECNNKCVSKCQNVAKGNTATYLNCFAKCSTGCVGERNKIPFNLTKPTESSLLPRIKLDETKREKMSKFNVKAEAVDQALADASAAMKSESESSIQSHNVVRGITAAKNAFDHYSDEQKSDGPDGKYITSEQRCDMCMKKTLEEVVAEKPATETLASFLTTMCSKSEGTKCELLKEKLIGHTLAHGKGKAIRLFCAKVHKVCRAFD